MIASHQNRVTQGSDEEWARGGAVMTGTIKRFVSDRGFGFIKPDDGGEDAFVHIRALAASGLGEPREGDRLSYELEPDERSGRMRAVRLKVVE